MVKKKILKIVSIILICCFLLFPCFGLSRCESKQDLEDLRNEGLLDPDESLGDDDQSEDDETESLYGVKVLYRPDSYDYNLSSGGTAEEENDYYGKYAWYIIFNLFQTFGIVNTTYNQYITYGTNLNVPQQAKDILNGNLYYLLYDSIRYHVNIIGKINNDSSNEDEDEVYYLVGADTASRWKWSFNYKLDNINDGNGRNFSSYISNNKNENNVYNKIKAFNTLYNYYTNNTWYQTTYKSTFVSSSSSTSEEEQAKDYKNT